MKIWLLPLLVLLFYVQSYSQTDTLISYNIETRQIDICSPIIIDTTKLFDHTEWNYGTESGLDLLNLTPPESTFQNSGFTDLTPVHDYFSVSNYPARTAVEIFFINNDSLKKVCSGVLVAENYVLTDCHCTGVYDSNNVFQFQDSIVVSPAFDNGKDNPLFGKGVGIGYITFKSNMKGFLQKDIALIKVKEEIGSKTGWIGIAFSKDDNYYRNEVFHKFSYPGTVDPTDSTRIFNGDTLYYNYGTLDLIEARWLGYNITGIPGQSGSSLFYTNNNEYYSLGTHVWASQSRHLRITPEIFYAFKPIINDGISNISDDNAISNSYHLSEAYPNPFNPRVTLNYELPMGSRVKLTIYNILGEEVATLVDGFETAGYKSVEFDASNVSSGVYFYRLQAGGYTDVKKMILMK